MQKSNTLGEQSNLHSLRSANGRKVHSIRYSVNVGAGGGVKQVQWSPIFVAAEGIV